MKIIDADFERRYEIPGVPGPACKPVDIDASKTGFTNLRSLRLYRFEAGSVIDGHAEGDEVFVIVTSGVIEMKIGWEDRPVNAAGTYTLASPGHTSDRPFVAYLPPRSVYQLTALTIADVAYARATPRDMRDPRVFCANCTKDSQGISVHLEERTHADWLRLKVVRIQPQGTDVVVDLLLDEDAGCEALVHVQGGPAETSVSIFGDSGPPLQMRPWQTAALHPTGHALLKVSDRADLLILAVLAA